MIFESQYTSDFLYDIVCSESESYMLGDINSDLLMYILDVVLIISFILEESIPTNLEFLASDLNQDDVVNVLDVVNIVNIILGES